MTLLEDNKSIELIEKLERASIAAQLPSSLSIETPQTISDENINGLIAISSILSLSTESRDLILAYEIITRLLESDSGNDERIASSAYVIFSRIGNFPGRTLLLERFKGVDVNEIGWPALLESRVREIENDGSEDNEKSLLLTDFQYKFYQSLKEENTLSISAPTSAGKSFVLGLDLVRKIQGKSKQSIVYIVPTRALITEVSLRIRAIVKENTIPGVILRTAPFPISIEKIETAAIYVFTQERFMSFLGSDVPKPFITSLIVDEAHEIQNGKRGIILQNSIDIALSRFPKTSILFASPLIKNPNYFLSLFKRDTQGKYFTETISPVSQNIISVNEVRGQTDKISISIIKENGERHIGNASSTFKFRGSKFEQRAKFALALASEDNSVISYSNNPSEAEKIACHISGLLEKETSIAELVEFSEFLKTEIHPDYPLAECVLKGAGFHYGNMPSLVRIGIEQLFKDGHLKIICCTSTLLQGVNLPAKHIIIENPKSGQGDEMSRANFLNLAGRAGRLLQEFHGNIWCIRTNTWDGKCLEGEKLQEVTSAVEQLMKDGGTAIQELLNDKISDSKKRDIAEAGFGKLYHDHANSEGTNDLERYKTDENSETLAATIKAIEGVEVTLPNHILEQNQALRPDYLQRFYNRLSTIDTESLTLTSPYRPGAKDRMDFIFGIINECFELKIHEGSLKYFSYLAYNWMRGDPIGKILSDRINFKQSNGSNEAPSKTIRDCLKVIEEEIRFKMVKYFAAYNDLFKHIISERNCKETESEAYHIYLEFGACSRNSLNLMAIGLSRFSALHLASRCEWPEGLDPEDYLTSLQKLEFNKLQIPNLCKKEIKGLAQ